MTSKKAIPQYASVPWRRTTFAPARLKHLVIAFLACATVLLAAKPDRSPAIQPDRWLSDVRYLASDELKGRGDGTPELDKAAAYIEKQFRDAGLEPLPGGFLQPFTANTGADLGKDNELTEAAPKKHGYKLDQDFIPLRFSGNGQKAGGAVFAGYGITASEYNYDDYQGLDVRGKIVIVLRHEPQENDDASIFRGRQLTRYAEFIAKAVNARDRGAIALLVVNDPVNHPGEDKLVPFQSVSGPSNIGIPVLQVKQAVVNDWLKGSGKSLADLQKSIDRDLSNHSFVLPADFDLTVHADVQQRRATLKNVIGVLRGSDPVLRDEYVVIGGHYDHLGNGEQGGSMAPAQIGQIHHGADDNASGTAGVMELARILGQEKPHLRRSILFMTYAGEELGLLGSAWYVQHPLAPLDKTVAMLNLDMIGRVSGNKLYIGGAGTSPEFRKLVEEENQPSGFDLDFSDLGYDASDHMSFGRNKVPVMFFFSGLHADYHKPSDTWDKVKPVETAKVLELTARIARHIDNADGRPAYTPPPARNQRGAGRGSDQGGYGPYFGSVPDFGQTEKGVKFADVREGSPAGKAGLKPGDVLVKFDGKPIENLYDFTYALQDKQPGDAVPVVVLRGGKEVEATVTLGRRE
jgi:peptidase M28-like protein/PDZ domain-containing protein/PA domain-containing protein